MEAIIQVMESTIGARDPYTVDHQQRTTNIAVAIARHMGLSAGRIEELQVAGSLHDLGKIAVPNEILSKPGKLTELEFAIIKTHPEVAYNILKPLEIPGQITNIIMQHHERNNGSGYPHGLKSRNILLEAKILGVADVVEAMCSHRPYRPALGLDRALEEISQKRGVLYEPEVVDSCLEIYQETPAAMRGEACPMDRCPALPETRPETPADAAQVNPGLFQRWQSLTPSQSHFVLHIATGVALGLWLAYMGRYL